MKIVLKYDEVYCGLDEFYKNVGRHLKDDIMGYMFDCRHIDISEEIQDIFYSYYTSEHDYDTTSITMLLAFAGPKANKNLTGYEVEVDDNFMNVANYTDMNVPDKVKDNVYKYFENNLPEYTVYNVYYKSNHDADNYLYMVLAKKNTDKNDDYAVWTCWNESTQSLNYGHYSLTEEKARKVLQEYFHDCTGKILKEIA